MPPEKVRVDGWYVTISWDTDLFAGVNSHATVAVRAGPRTAHVLAGRLTACQPVRSVRVWKVSGRPDAIAGWSWLREDLGLHWLSREGEWEKEIGHLMQLDASIKAARMDMRGPMALAFLRQLGLSNHDLVVIDAAETTLGESVSSAASGPLQEERSERR